MDIYFPLMLIILGMMYNSAMDVSLERTMDEKLVLCGETLTSLFSALCIESYSPYQHPYSRRKRAIAQECCVEPCTTNELLSNYCKVQNETAVEMFRQGHATDLFQFYLRRKSFKRFKHKRPRRSCKSPRKHTKEEKYILSRNVPQYIIGYTPYEENVPLLVPISMK
ncbi:uncharacterized protein LOC115882045 [Sitophilus oryzae]|uniref:Uncharacterized protein LOC115882045 n=1 Tax=Sitophilus oryzae TaxID=7048 RepID=A0A6J2XW52_SITOR|nr:uncharacterized protein LOC115882045 [Sitophilus oryzae]